MAYDDYRRSGRDRDDRYGRDRGWSEDRDTGWGGGTSDRGRGMSGRDRERDLGYGRPDYDPNEWAGRDREIRRGYGGGYGAYGGYGGYREYGDRFGGDRGDREPGGYTERGGYADRGEFRNGNGYDERDYGYGRAEGYRGRGRGDMQRDMGRFDETSRDRDMSREASRGGWDSGRDFGYRGGPADRGDFDRDRGNRERYDELDRGRGWGMDRDYGNGEWGRGASRRSRRDWDRDTW